MYYHCRWCGHDTGSKVQPERCHCGARYDSPPPSAVILEIAETLKAILNELRRAQ